MNDRLFIIGEAGVNHDGSLDKAKKLVDIAVEAGCDAVKFQTWITERVYCRTLSQKPEYMLRTTDAEESEFETVKRNELSFDAFRELKQYCDLKGILFFSTPDESESADFLFDLGVPLFKVASQDVTNPPFLRYLAKKGLPVICSSGAATFSELSEAIETLFRVNKQILLMHCVSAYPAPVDQLNLSLIPKLAAVFGVPVGFSDHTIGKSAACAAVGLGARFFEKHFTLDRSLPGPDHQASLNPEELTDYVASLREAYKSLGGGIKRVMPCEENVRTTIRRYLVSARRIESGEIFTEKDFVFKKISQGIPPKELDRIVGRRAVRTIDADMPMDWNDIYGI